jgi:putative membrane-bound dehydrogenase-like protein
VNRVVLLALLVLMTSSSPRGQAEDGPLPRFEPLEPAEALASFRTQGGFRMELLAAEPMVLDPVAGAFDADGRLYVAEMADYPHVDRANDQPFRENTGDPPIGRVRLLIDLDDDGVFDESHLFAEGLSWPTGVAPWEGGIFVAATPDLWYLKDLDGDHKADVRERIYTGFRKYNIQAVMNNLAWGLDHRIYGAGSSNGGQIRRADLGDAEPVPLLRSDFRFDPRSLAFEPIGGGARFGNTFDDQGNRFLCNIRNPAQHVVLPEPPLAPNPWIPLPTALHDVAAAGDTIVMHRISPPEPWRELRARRWVDIGKPLPRSELVGAGYLTSSSGITSYRGDAYPESVRGDLFLGEVANNLIHRMAVRPDGVTFIAERADEGDVEFVASTDTWFRPVNFVNAPDGTLLVLDMYRETIEHPWSIPDDIRDRLDLRSGDDRGRIYRLSPPGFKPRPSPKLHEATTAGLVSLLEHPNAWHRETAHRLIFERQDSEAIEPLRAMLIEGGSPAGRLHALWSLEGLDALGDEDLLAAMARRREEDAPLLAQVVRIAGTRLDGAPWLLDSVVLGRDIGADPPAVRLQVALALGASDDPASSTALARLAHRFREDPWMKAAALGSAGRDPIAVFRMLVGLAGPDEATELREVLGPLAFAIGAGSGDEDASAALDALSGGAVASIDAPAAEVAMRLGDGLIRRGSGLFEVEASGSASHFLDHLLDEARLVSGDPEASPSRRVRAASLFAHRPFGEARQALVPLLERDEPAEVRLAAVDALARFGGEPDVAGLLLAGWKEQTPAVRDGILAALVARPSWSATLLDAIEAGELSPGQIPSARRSALLRSRDDSVRARASRLFEQRAGGPPPGLVARYLDALGSPGDPERGRAVFDRACATCHQLGDRGHAVGPNLASVSRRTPDELLTHILDPNREVAPDATEYVVALGDGRVASGMIESESAASITLIRAEGERETILRRDVDELASSGRSLMPEGLEKDIAPAEMADLITFLLRLQSL